MTAKSSRDWDELGAREPYFAVLSEPRFLRENLDEAALKDFYATGEADVERFFRLAGHPVVDRALEFGCGVGRLTLPMARRVGFAMGLDTAESLLRLAREEAAARRITNVELCHVDVLDRLDAGSFDLVYSYIVFQHLPISDGERYFRRLLDLIAPGGTALLHFTTVRPGGPLRRLARRLRAGSRLVHRLAAWLRNERDLPYMQMNEYDESRIVETLIESGFGRPLTIRTDHGGIHGLLFIASRNPAA